MANLFLFITVMVMVGAKATLADGINNNNDPFEGFPFGSQFPFPKMKFPKIQIPTFKPLAPFPKFKPFPKIKIPTADEIINRKPRPGETINSVVVKSATGYTMDETGKTKQTGGTYIYTNNNGDIKEFKVGDIPPLKEGNVIISKQEHIEPGASATSVSASASSVSEVTV
ncbi:unnamed protein product [Parnassius mnemosyne]|uniref:Uncharacterized protein n=1 Tax=Parnassius mnemosyne TaxID=213953 RepID=A0AAV1M5R5_9NEOP